MKNHWQTFVAILTLTLLIFTGCDGETAAAPVVAVAPQNPAPGETVQVTADGYGSSIEVQVGAGPEDADFAVQRTAQTDADGHLTIDLTVPETAQPDNTWVIVVRENEPDGAQATSNTFKIGAPTTVQPTPTPEATESAPTDTPAPSPEAVISPVSGPPGTDVQLVASGLPADATLEIGVGRTGSEYDVIQTETSDSAGNLEAQVIIPDYAEAGEAWVVVVVASEADMTVVSNEFTITDEEISPSVAIAPLSGQAGTEVTVTASGFPANTALEIGAGPVDSEYDVITTGESSISGGFSTRVAIPEEADPGEDWVVVVSTADHTMDAVSEAFQVTDGTQPTVTISPLSGPPGTTVQVSAAGFPASTEVQVGAGREGSEFGVTQRVDTDPQGRLLTSIAIPEFAEPGDPWAVVVRVVAQGGARASSQTFEVTQQEGDLFERTQIYLIAVGDEGESGQEIGCGDSVVPVEVPIEPTIAPLTAGLKELLAIDSRMYGESGLYNALHQSDLTLEEVNIQDGEAVIRLSGSLVIGGTCDAPRVRAQLEQTALQYSTVDSVAITINGEPLETTLQQGNRFERTQIYLIALEDAGESGQEIGCGDSVVPVEVPIEPTIAPLAPTLEELLAIDSRMYGESGLYNALYQSDLTIEEVAVQDGEAVIRLSGTLEIGGTCDAPRVRAQLEQTALQFSTVDSVSITINGEPLETYLQQ